MIVESKKRKLEWESLHIYIYISFLSLIEKNMRDLLKKQSYRWKKAKRRICGVDVGRRCVISQSLRLSETLSAYHLFGPCLTHISLVSNRNRARALSRIFTDDSRLRLILRNFFFFIYLARSINKKPSRSKR